MKQRRRCNHLGPIRVTSCMVESVEDVREAVYNHFGTKFLETEEVRPCLEGISLNSISSEEAEGLESPFLEREIKEAVWACGVNKSPGPDGYSFLFFKKCWHFVKFDFICYFNYLFVGKDLSKAVTSSFLTLIPKTSNLIGLDEYRPICLVGCMYKVVAKLLVGRLKGVLHSIISSSQSAFVPGRQLLDGVLVANEVVDFARKEGKRCTLFKVDFEKAYDKVSWNFLRYMLRRMGFGDNWMESLVFTSSMLVLVNGSPTKEFNVSRGLRQGDPLSPFIFVIVAEGLSGLIRQSIELREFQRFVIKESCSMDILQFAGDTLIVGDGSWKHVWAIKAVLRAFEIISGLGINYHKSKLIGINTNRGFLEGASFLLSCKLVFPLDLIRERRTHGSRLMPKKVRRVHWVKWEDVTLLVDKGGLGVKNSSLFNVALLNKWRWRILQGQDSLWFEVLKARYGDLSSNVFCTTKDAIVSPSCSFWWKDLLKVSFSFKLDPIVERTSFVVNNGFCTPFWDAKWILDEPLKEAFPALYELSCLKKVSIAAMGGWMEGVWKWVNFGISDSLVSNDALAEELVSLKRRVEEFRGWGVGKDSVVWSGCSDKEFSVASCYHFLDSIRILFGPANVHDGVFSLIWKLEVPFKIKAFGWRLFRNRLPTREMLVSRGVVLPLVNSFCIFCGNDMETMHHLFFRCGVVKKIWSEIEFSVGKSNSFFDECFSHFMEWHSFFDVNMVKVRKLGIIWLATIWAIWLVRNGVCFRDDPWNVNNTVWNIKLLAWKWSFCGNITHSNYSFYEFCKEPIYFLS
ncbi:uncharacterized protein LOC131629577 [Vicia villosa]|uniref:uncharacterized protein LOC131629577 n=1 Tax=Vicia villosa TaxID=3911 RepID=UPI00273C7A3F|nr:uncharacterized protein LOC131629577 [Vicia villosa]